MQLEQILTEECVTKNENLSALLISKKNAIVFSHSLKKRCSDIFI